MTSACGIGERRTASRRGGGLRAFTLIELLVVAAIIIIIMAVTFPAYSKMTSGNSKKQAVNAISAQAASARSLALSMQRQVALVFYEDPTNTYQTRMVVVQAIPGTTTASGTEFGAIPDRPSVSLPRFIKVASLDVTTAAGAFAAEWGATGGAKCRAFVFDERGRPVVRNGLIAFDLGGSNPRSALVNPNDTSLCLWGLAPSSANASGYGSTLSLVVYDTTELNDARLTTDAEKATWLLTYSDIVTIHPYTGTVVR